MPRDCLRIIESKSKVRNSRNKPVVAKVSASTSTPGISSEVAELKEMVKALLLQKKYNLHRLLLPVKRLRKVVLLAVVLIPTKLVQPLLAMFIEIISKNMSLKQPQLIQPRKHRMQLKVKTLQNQLNNLATSNQRLESMLGITTRSGVAYKGPAIHTTSSPKVVERDTEVTKDTMHPTNNGSTEDVPPPVVPIVNHESISEPTNAPVSAQGLTKKHQFHFLQEEMMKDVEVSKTSRALIDVYEGEKPTCWQEDITVNLDQTSENTLTKFLVSQMNLKWHLLLTMIQSSHFSPTLTSIRDSDFLLFEEADSFLALEDDPTSPEVDPTYYDPEGDILLLEAILNSEPSPPLQGNYFPETRKDLKICEANHEKSSVNEPPEVELKDLPPHLEYAFLEGDDKLPS
ncbi:hypothetical protein Tco_0150067 [Tanacetum coccineum]